MSAGSGLDLAALCTQKYPDTVVILVSGHERFDFAQEAIRQGVFAYLLKPLLDSEVAQTMERLLKQLPDRKTGVSNAAAPDTLIGQALSYIDAHYNVSLPLEAVADALYVNKSYLSDLFSKTVGMTFTQYKNTVRINHAKELIRKGGYSMTDIAQMTGFDSSSRATFFIKIHQMAHVNNKVGMACAMAMVLMVLIIIFTIAQRLFFRYVMKDSDNTFNSKANKAKTLW